MLLTLEKTAELIRAGKTLHIAADERLLDRLPAGSWIGGTTPYFITDKGGIEDDSMLFVEEFSFPLSVKSAVYGADIVSRLPSDAYPNGFTVLIVPFGSAAASAFAKEAPHSGELIMAPTVGWISGYRLSDDATAKAYDGFTGTSYSDRAVALHVGLPEGKMADIAIVNIFEPDLSGPVLRVDADTTSIGECAIDGKRVNFADFIEATAIDTTLPLITDSNGSYLNVSVKSVSPDRKVELFAPVLADYEYRFAKKVPDYSKAFTGLLAGLQRVSPVFSCNCILNYLYGKLEGRSTPPFAGPVTFGEIAYQLLNQTLVYVEIKDV